MLKIKNVHKSPISLAIKRGRFLTYKNIFPNQEIEIEDSELSKEAELLNSKNFIIVSKLNKMEIVQDLTEEPKEPESPGGEEESDLEEVTDESDGEAGENKDKPENKVSRKSKKKRNKEKQAIKENQDNLIEDEEKI